MLLSVTNGLSQDLNLGTPQITNFNKEDYDAGTQNWATLWNNGRQSFANNGGLLEYDGSSWTIHPTPKNTIIRSLAAIGNDTIYIGAQEELGFFAPDSLGQLSYNSILEELEKDQNLEEIWNMVHNDKKLFIKFKNDQILVYDSNSNFVLKTPSTISKLALVGNVVWYHVLNNGLFRIENENTVFIENSGVLKDYTISDFLQDSQGNIFILTEKNGIWLYDGQSFIEWESNAAEYLYKHRISCGIIHQEEIIIGTNTGGVVVIQKNGKARLVLTKENGLQNNSIVTLGISEEHILWIITGNGIDQINLSETRETFYPDDDLEGGVYDIETWNGNIFFCTSNGVYYIKEREYYNPFDQMQFKMVPKTEGQAWGLDVINEVLFCAHHTGGFIINKDMSIDYLEEESGVWKFIKLDEKTLALGTYSGVCIIKKDNSNWKMDHTVPGINISSRIMLFDKDRNLWLSHPYKNLFKINFNKNYTYSSIKTYNAQDGLQTNLRNYVFSLNDKCVVTNETGCYEYDEGTDQFIPSPILSKYFTEGVHLKRIVNCDSMIWTISTLGTDKIKFTHDGQVSKVDFGLDEKQANYIGGFEHLYPLNDNTILICSDKGVHKVSAKREQHALLRTIITGVSIVAGKDSLIYGGHGKAHPPELLESQNSIMFSFSSLSKIDKKKKFYQYLLQGFDTDWSMWTLSNTKEYNKLDHGSYSFLVRAINEDGIEGPVTSFPFTIVVPWYKTYIANILGWFLLLMLLIYLFLLPNKKLQKTTAQLAAQKLKAEAETKKIRKQAEVETERLKLEADAKAKKLKQKAFEEIEQMRREKLQSEIEFKNKELAMSTMILLQKNETIKAIRGEIEQAEKNVKDPQAKKEIKKIVSLLRSDDRMEDDWNNFSIHFDQAHHQFLKRVKEKFPNLTPKDQKLCAYLRMNLTTKEIAPLLKISIRGVEISRYRLRKKIGLDKAKNLNDFMMNF